ncbi:response regulator transcription factor [Bizionia argentinensis JUB59]|uniref:Response regulator transcription factor n=1 Tax=Bizionia argentinensis JUB59 TaxID=1046627 RepID=G2EAI0_9FLAO|nr:response regulator transcription factor [Bizionia argentinensis]EGV44571.1 response regulator transcription factor [Bizionia argentinensis JUB59]
MHNGTRILVADDHGIVRMGLVQIIKQLRPQALLSEAEDYKSLSALISKESFDLVILDVNMPNGTLQQAIDFIKLKQPELKILIFSSQDEQLYALRYLKMGANGFLNKLSPKEQIDEALSAMFLKGQYISDEIKDSMVSNTLNKQQSSSPIEVLSNRELEVANKLVEGLPLKELSNQLNLHTSTVSTYKNRVFEKLDIQSIPELVEIFRIYNQ